MVGDAIVGRADEVQAVHRFLDRIGGEGCALVLAGGPGIGKTIVWQHALAGAAGRSVTRLSCRPVETEAKLAFAALADLLEPVADLVLPEIPAPQRTALEVALLRAAPEGAPPNPRAVATAVLSMLRRLTERGPLVLAIDDEQWLDRASAEALAFALRRLGPRPLGVLTTLRLEADPAHDALGLDAAFAGRIERRLLGPLSASALHHVIRQHLGQVFPRPTLHRLTETAGGNPFYALELARALLDDGGPVEPSAPLPVPATLADLMARRLDRLAQRHRHVLLLASAAAAPTVTLVHELAGARAGAEGLARATQARLVEVHDGRVRFAHPLLAAAVYRAAPAATRREVHRQLATVAAPEERARHLALAAVAADEAVARVLDDAAILARRRGAPEDAAELQEQAARLTPPDDASARRRRTIGAAEHLYHAGNLERARDVLDGVLAEGPADDERSAALLILARIRAHEGGYAEAHSHLTEALSRSTAPQARVEIAIDLAHAMFSMGDVSGAVNTGREVLGEAEHVGDDGLLARLLALITVGESLTGLGTDWRRMARALALEDRSRGGQLMLSPTVLAGLMESYEGRLSAADARLAEVCAWATDRGEESSLAFLQATRSWIAWWRGDLAGAVQHAEDLLVLSQQTSSVAGRVIALLHRSRARGTAGHVAEARADLADARALSANMAYPMALLFLNATDGTLALWFGDARHSLDTLSPLWPAIEQLGLNEGPLVYALCDAIEASIELGNHVQADDWLERLHRYIPDRDRPWAVAAVLRCRSLLAAASDDLGAALAAAGEAVRRWQLLEMPVEHGRALLTLGQIQRRRGERRSAREALERAQAIFRAHGADLWAKRVAAELRRIPARRAASDDLTPTEEQVATLAAAGNTNLRVAQMLFMSPKTVEANLSRVYGKLGIRSRAELGARMAARRTAMPGTGD